MRVLRSVYFLLQKALLEVLYDIFQLTIPVATTDFTEALISVGGYIMTSPSSPSFPLIAISYLTLELISFHRFKIPANFKRAGGYLTDLLLLRPKRFSHIDHPQGKNVHCLIK